MLGLGDWALNIPLIKTISAWKKSTLESSHVYVPHSSTEGGALRALKALARSK
jgi:hypothetical protein